MALAMWGGSCREQGAPAFSLSLSLFCFSLATPSTPQGSTWLTPGRDSSLKALPSLWGQGHLSALHRPRPRGAQADRDGRPERVRDLPEVTSKSVSQSPRTLAAGPDLHMPSPSLSPIPRANVRGLRSEPGPCWDLQRVQMRHRAFCRQRPLSRRRGGHLNRQG